MPETTFTDNPLWSTETVRKLVTILLPHRGEKFDHWYAHEIKKAYHLGHDSYKEFLESADPYNRYQYLMPPTATEVLPEVIDYDNMELFDSPGAREHLWQDSDGDYWRWDKGYKSWERIASITRARGGFDREPQVTRYRPWSVTAPFTCVERVS